MKSSKMAVVFGECGRECLSGPGNTGIYIYSAFSIECAGGGCEEKCLILVGEPHPPPLLISGTKTTFPVIVTLLFVRGF